MSGYAVMLTLEDGSLLIADMPDGVIAPQSAKRVEYPVTGHCRVTASGPSGRGMDNLRIKSVEVVWTPW